VDEHDRTAGASRVIHVQCGVLEDALVGDDLGHPSTLGAAPTSMKGSSSSRIVVRVPAQTTS
jgi:hypothetical protein